MRVTSINFGSAYIRDEIKGLLSGAQQNAIYEIGNNYSDKHIIAGLFANDTPRSAKKILLRINDTISVKELSRIALPLNFSPERLKKFPRYIFHA